jgi:hypothetical protein
VIESGKGHCTCQGLNEYLKSILVVHFPLTDQHGVETGAEVTFKLALHSEFAPSAAQIELHRANKKAEEIEDSLNHLSPLDGSGPLAVASGYVDTTSAIAGSAYQLAQDIGSAVEPLGHALQSLEQIVKVVDGIADVTFTPVVRNVSQTDFLSGPSYLQGRLDGLVFCLQGTSFVLYHTCSLLNML